MELIKPIPAWTDSRGTITDLLNDVPIMHVGHISSRAGTVRGNHYHKSASQYTFVVKGKLESVSREPGQAPTTTILSTGGFVLHPPYSEHAFRFIDDTDLLDR